MIPTRQFENVKEHGVPKLVNPKGLRQSWQGAAISADQNAGVGAQEEEKEGWRLRSQEQEKEGWRLPLRREGDGCFDRGDRVARWKGRGRWLSFCFVFFFLLSSYELSDPIAYVPVP